MTCILICEAKKCWKPKPEIPSWRWAEENIILSPRMPTARPGAYKTSLTPYVRGILDALEDVMVNKVTVCKGAQTGLTLTAYIALCYWICEAPGPALLVMPSELQGKSASENRLQPLIEESPRVAMELLEDRDAFKKLEYKLRRSVVNIVGSNSPANLASRPVKYLILDETDKYPDQSEKEAKPINLAIERTKTFWDRKIIEISTPTTKAGHIEESFKDGNQCRFFLPCPKCGDFQYLKFGQIKFDKSKSIPQSAAEAYYECEFCQYEISNEEKNGMLNAGEWRPTAEAQRGGHVSFHLPSFYAPWVSFADVVENFRTSEGNNAALQNFINSTLGEIWEEPPKKSIEGKKVIAIRDRLKYERGRIPTNAEALLFMTVDVQAQHLVFSVWATNRYNLYLIDHGYLSTFEDINAIFVQPYFNEDNNECYIKRVLLDTGYRTMEAYKYALIHPEIIPIKGEQGRGTRQDKPIRPSQIHSFPGGKMFGGKRTLNLFHIHPSQFKDELSRAFDEDGDVNIWFHSGIDKDYIKQVTGEVLKEGKPDKFGNKELYWAKIRSNDYFDCAQYAFAARHLAHKELVAMEARRQSGGAQPHDASTEQSGQVKKVVRPRRRATYA